MPSGGAVHLGRALPAAGGLNDLNIRVLQPSWKAALEPLAVGGGFLRATANDDDDYAIARSYLTGAGANRWRPSDGITIYDEVALRVGDSPGSNGSPRHGGGGAPAVGQH